MQGVGVEQQELSRPGNPEQCAEHVAEFSVHGAGVWSICPLLRPPLMTVTRGNPPSPHTYFISPDLPGCTAVQVKAILGVGEGSGQNTESCAVCLCVCVCVCVCVYCQRRGATLALNHPFSSSAIEIRGRGIPWRSSG